jgi:hypothetical protein
MYDWETFQAAYRAASEEQKAVIDGEAIGLCTRAAIARAALDESHYKPVVKLCCLLVLNAVSPVLVVNEMKKLGIPNSDRVLEDLRQCIASTPTTLSTPQNESLDSDIAEMEAALSATTNTTPPPTIPVPPPAPEFKPLSQTEIPRAPRQPEVTYSSTQAALLNERKPASTPAQWGDEE